MSKLAIGRNQVAEALKASLAGKVFVAKGTTGLAEIRQAARTAEVPVVTVNRRKLEELAGYCRRDVELTRRLYEMWGGMGLLWVSATEYVVWPGVRTAEELGELEESRGAGEQRSRVW